jgi:hypothetical protein
MKPNYILWHIFVNNVAFGDELYHKNILGLNAGVIVLYVEGYRFKSPYMYIYVLPYYNVTHWLINTLALVILLHRQYIYNM